MLTVAIEKITAQQPKERTDAWMVGEQLKDILIDNPHLAEIVAQDLDVAEMSLTNCAKKIKKYADGHKTGSFACVTPSEAEKIIREFYGLTTAPEQTSEKASAADGAKAPASGSVVVNLEDFF